MAATVTITRVRREANMTAATDQSRADIIPMSDNRKEDVA